MRRICAVVVAACLAACGLDAQILCWNVENYFDNKDDPATADEPFTPGGEYRWTRRKYEAKRNLIAKTIIAGASCFGGEMPALVGLCEVENAFVLKTLVEDTPLARVRYRTLHRDSPDPRGIDVALLYDPSRVRLLGNEFITIKEFRTREILYAKVVLCCGAPPSSAATADSVVIAATALSGPEIRETLSQGHGSDTLHLFVNHWPSKYGGAKASETRRQAVCAALEHKLDSIRATDPGAMILVMGDFNDTPDSPTITGLCERQNLTNLTGCLDGGTIRYKGKWETIDQMLASPALAARTRAAIFAPAFLLEEDKTFMGSKPRRTNTGPRYNGGVSDHLPVVAEISR